MKHEVEGTVNERDAMNEKTKSKCVMVEGDIALPTRAERDAASTVELVTREENEKQIGELREQVCELNGQIVYLRGLIAALQGTVIEVQQREVQRLANAANDSPAVGCHVNSGLLCVTAHQDGHGNQQPPCVMCKRCGEYIRPDCMRQDCPGKTDRCDNRVWLGSGSVPE